MFLKLANHLVSVRLVSRRELYNCLIDYCFWSCYRGTSLLFHVGIYYPPYLKNVTFRLYFTSDNSLSILCISQDLKKAGWFSWQFERLVSFGQSSSVWFGSFSPHLPHVKRPLQISLWWPYFWHLKYLESAEMYCSTLLRQYQISAS